MKSHIHQSAHDTDARGFTTFIYVSQIPTGAARTKGYGCTCNVWIVRGPLEKFKTLNSKRSLKKFVGQARFDYGLISGRSRALLAEAEGLLEQYSMPAERTTRDEY